jgi:hypothetical protein
MADEKTPREQLLEKQIKILVERQRSLMALQGSEKPSEAAKGLFPIEKEDLVRGIIMREVLGPPKGLEG